MSNESKLIRQIESAFDGVVLGNGISLNMAQFIDSCGTAPEYKAAAQADEREDWRDIPDEVLETFSDTFCFTDLEGYRFYIAPYMIWTIQHHRESDDIIADFTIYALHPARHQFETVRFTDWFTSEQLDAIVAFLEYCVVNNGTLDGTAASDNLLAIRKLL